MSVFEPVVLSWKGEEYKVEADRVMMLIAKIEDVITLSEVFSYGQKGSAPMAKIAMAYGVALRYAGAKVRDDEVYKGLFGNGGSSTAEALNALLAMMIPPEDLQQKGSPDGEGKQKADSSS